MTGLILVLCGVSLLCVGRWCLCRADQLTAQADRLQVELNAFIADHERSSFCCRSIVYLLGEACVCECFYCRRERNEPVTEESQAMAKRIQTAAM